MSSPPHICNTETRDLGTRVHGGLSPERDHGVERGPASLEPAIGQDARRATVDFWKETIITQTISCPSLNLCPLSLSMFKLWLQFQKNVGQINERKSRKLVWWFISSLFKSKVIKFFLNHDSLLELNPNHSTSISRGYWEILDKQKQKYNQPSQPKGFFSFRN